MSGYQEVLTDPSYAGQIVVMTAPHVGNYGVNSDDAESADVRVAGFAVREAARWPSSWRSERTLGAYLAEAGVVGIEGTDTRALTLHIREAGAMRAVISTEDLDALGTGPPGAVDARRRPRGHGVHGRAVRGPRRGRAGDAARGRPPAGGRARLGAEAEQPPDARPQRVRDGGLPGPHSCRGDPGERLRRRVPFERPRRPCGHRIRGRDDSCAPRAHPAVRDLPGPPGAGPGDRRHDVQAEVRPPRRQPAGAGRRIGPRGDHEPQPWFRGRSTRVGRRGPLRGGRFAPFAGTAGPAGAAGS